MFKRVLIANRGEIACRIIRTCRRLGIEPVTVHSEIDEHSRHVLEADHSVLIGPAAAKDSYLDGDKIVAAALATGAEAIHPGYGFLSENAAFARSVIDAGLAWVGPSAEAIELMGDKLSARNLMDKAGVPVAPGGSGAVTSTKDALDAAERIGYPVMVKASAGGGGIGMSIASNNDELTKAIGKTSERAEQSFGDRTVFVEKYFQHARHIEVQILGCNDGSVLAIGDRDCSVQRRHQKVLEEAPAPRLDESFRSSLHAAAIRAGQTVNYHGAGTVEFLVSDDQYMFLEMNTRLQVEHPITEMVMDLDLVEQQFLVAAGEKTSIEIDSLAPCGSAIELRIYAEDPVHFLPRPGKIEGWKEPVGDGIRVDSGYTSGDVVSPFYDPLLAKVCVWGPDRPAAIARAEQAVDDFAIDGIQSNLELFRRLLPDPDFVSGNYDTGILSHLPKTAETSSRPD